MARKKNNKDIINERIHEVVADSDLSVNEQDFVLFYLESNNITQSYLKAYGCDKKFANVKGSELLHRPKIKAEVKRLKKLLSVAYDVDPSKYIEFLLKAANANIGDYIKFSEEEEPVLGPEGIPMINPDTQEPVTRKINRMHLGDSNKLDTKLITEIKQGRDGISIKIQDQFKAWEKLKEFFEWKNKAENNSKIENNLIDAISGKVETTWSQDSEEDDLKELERNDT